MKNIKFATPVIIIIVSLVLLGIVLLFCYSFFKTDIIILDKKPEGF